LTSSQTIPNRHSRVGGNPEITGVSTFKLDTRFRGYDIISCLYLKSHLMSNSGEMNQFFHFSDLTKKSFELPVQLPLKFSKNDEE
jgi:hypothetical protein